MKIAILVDGGFYRRVALYKYGEKNPEERAKELNTYCLAHLNKKPSKSNNEELYRIFYYDCPPIEKQVFNPITKTSVSLKNSPSYIWTNDFFNYLKKQRKVALRLGVLSEEWSSYTLNKDAIKKLLNKKITVDDLTEKDLVLELKQKGVDMKIGIDIASLAYKKQVDKIILISGDSDFVPAAKLARREGIDFVLDAMGQNIKEDLSEHIDGLESSAYKPKLKK